MTTNKQAQALIDLSVDCWNRSDIQNAEIYIRSAVHADPYSSIALMNLGTTLLAQGKIEAANECYNAAYKLNPDDVDIILNIALFFNDIGDVKEAYEWTLRAEQLRPLCANVIWRKSLAELALGDYLNGFRNYEAALGVESIRGKSIGFRMGQWDGSYCNRLVIWHEQGLGDTLQFVRYAKLCKTLANKVIVLCPKELIEIVKSCPYVDYAVESVSEGDFDAHVSIMSLPYVFKTTLPTVPQNIPYLFAEESKKRFFKDKMPGNKIKVGICWQGNPRKHSIRFQIIDGKRSFPLAQWKPLFDLPNADFYSLQFGESRKDIKDNGMDEKIIDLMDDVTDFSDTAAIISNLDFVISVDTSVVHLAGGLGKPVWVLSRFDACWRWLRNNPSNPWYPNARVFGQKSIGDWDGVINKVTSDLKAIT